MANVYFSLLLQRYVACPPLQAGGHSVREVLEACIEQHPRLRGYLLDDQGGLRPRLAVFVDGVGVEDRTGLSDPVHLFARVYVAQQPWCGEEAAAPRNISVSFPR
jgi:hypothetical protein